MTQGLKFFDEMRPITLQTGPTRFGSYFRKEWTGTDSAPRTRVPKEYIEIALPYRDKFGHLRYAKHRQRVRVNRPRRVKYLEPHPYTLSLVEEYCYQGVAYDYYDNALTSTFESWIGKPSAVQKWTSNDDIALLGKLRVAIAGSDFNVLTLIGEGHESLAMIATAAHRISEMYSGLRSGNIPRAIHALSGIDDLKSGKARKNLEWLKRKGGSAALTTSQAVLELRYGWGPLLQDAEAGAQWLAQLTLGYKQKYRVVRRVAGLAKSPVPFVIFPYQLEGAENRKNKGGFTSDSDLLAYTKGGIIATLTEVNVPALAGISADTAIQTAWELVPFSFVADWFLPIGDYLAARGVAQAIRGEFCTWRKVVKQIPSSAAIRDPNYPSDLGEWGFDFPYDSWKTVSFSRSISSSLDVPLPSVKPLAKSLSWVHCQNAVALATGMVFSDGRRKLDSRVDYTRPDFRLSRPTGAS